MSMTDQKETTENQGRSKKPTPVLDAAMIFLMGVTVSMGFFYWLQQSSLDSTSKSFTIMGELTLDMIQEARAVQQYSIDLREACGDRCSDVRLVYPGGESPIGEGGLSPTGERLYQPDAE